MAEQTEYGIVINGKDKTGPAFKSAGKGAVDLGAKFKGLGNQVNSMPDKFGKAAASMMLMQGATAQMGGKAADAANKVTALAAVAATGGPLGIALAGATALAMAGAAAWDVFTQSARHAEGALRSLANVQKAQGDMLVATQANLEALNEEIEYFGLTAEEAEIAKLEKSIETRKRVIDTLQSETLNRNISRDAKTDELALEVKTNLALKEGYTAAENRLDIDRKRLNAMRELQAKRKQAEDAAKKEGDAEKRMAEAMKRSQEAAKKLISDMEKLKKTEEDAAKVAERASASRIDSFVAGREKERAMNLELQEQMAFAAEEDRQRSAEIAAQKRADAIQTAATMAESYGGAFMDIAAGQMTLGDLTKKVLGDVLNMAVQTAIKRITINAAETATEGAKATAGIPIIGPALAATVAGGLFAMVQGYLSKFAVGGFVTGGRAGFDSVPAILKPGEYVMNTSEVAAARSGSMPARLGGGQDAGGTSSPVNINVGVAGLETRDSKRRFVMDIAKEMERGQREGWLRI